MKKLLIAIIAGIALAGIACAGMLDTLVLTKSGVTTSTTHTLTSGSINGIILAVDIDVNTACDIDIDLYDWQSNTIYTADDVAADVTFWPAYQVDRVGGAAAAYDATNNVKLIQIPNGGKIFMYTGDANSATCNVSATILYQKR